MLTTKATKSLLFASPPAVRSEILRRAFSSSPPLATRGLPLWPDKKDHGSVISVRRYIFKSTTLRTLGIRSASTATPSEPITAAPTTSTPSTPTIDTTSPQPPPPKPRRYILSTTLFLLSLTAGFAMATAPVADSVNGFINPPSDAQTLTLFDPPTPTAAEINDHIINHPLAQKLRQQEGMVESRPHLKIPPAMRPHNLTGGTLLGDDKIAVPPLTFQEKEGGVELPSLVQISYLGAALCGHPGIVHGGLLATLLDEGLARACFPALPNKVGVTASLKIDYRVPCPAESYVVLKAQTTKVEGRKAWVKGWIEILEDGDGEGKEGKKVVEAEALFIEPKGAKQMARVYSSQ